MKSVIVVCLVCCYTVAARGQAIPTPLEPTRSNEPALPWAGYQNGTFYLRDPHDWFVLYPKGRLQIDGYLFPNRGASPATGVTPNSASDARPRDTIFVRRARVELLGTVIGHFDFQIAAEYASTPQTGSTGIVSDAFVIVDYLAWLKLQVGQFDAPFTMENRTSDKYIDFMERSLAVRALGVPLNKDQGGMLWGWLPKQLAYYSAGVFDGDGGSFKSQDSRPAIIGRGFVAPLAFMGARHPWLQQLWVGGSFWWKNEINAGGPVAANLTGAAQNDITSMTTQGAQTFFSSSYADGKNAAGSPVRSHLAPWGRTLKWAVEANVPFWRRMGARFELVHDDIALARYDDSGTANAALARAPGLRGAQLRGTAYYLELFGWIIGDSSFLQTPGLEPMPRLKRGPVPRPRWGLMLALKYGHLGMDLGGITAAGTGVTSDPTQGHYSVDTFEAGLNAWGTNHVRLTADYVVNYIDGTSAQVRANYFYRRAEHEVLLRVGINL
ncbi:MAG: porin [Polyangia bacterium]